MLCPVLLASPALWWGASAQSHGCAHVAGKLHLPPCTGQDSHATVKAACLAPACGTGTQQPQARAGRLTGHSRYSHRLSGHRKALSSGALTTTPQPHQGPGTGTGSQPRAELVAWLGSSPGASQHMEHHQHSEVPEVPGMERCWGAPLGKGTSGPPGLSALTCDLAQAGSHGVPWHNSRAQSSPPSPGWGPPDMREGAGDPQCHG